MNKRTEQFSNLIYIIIGVFLAVVMSGAARSPYNETGVLLGLNFNLVTYIAALAAAFVLWLALMGVSALLSGRGKDDGGEEDRSRTPRSLPAGILCAHSCRRCWSRPIFPTACRS